MLSFLREAAWLNGPRARAYAWIIGIELLITFVLWAGNTILPALSDPHLLTEPRDFDAFWAGAHLARLGQPEAVYVEASIKAAERLAAHTPADPGQYFPYLYPPVFIMLTLPLAWLPPLPAMIVFMGAGWAAFIGLVRKLVPRPFPLLPVIAFPAALLNAVIEQNGFFTASSFAGAMVLIERRPGLAGACLGLLIAKPHLAICVPVVLIAARRWRVLFACGTTVATLCLLSWLSFGSAVWIGFREAAPQAKIMMAHPITWTKLVSVFSALRLLHLPEPAAYTGQAVCGIATILLVARFASARPGVRAELAVAIPAAMLCTPYVFDYDQVCLGVTLAWLAQEALRTRWLGWEKITAAAVFVLPAVARVLGVGLGVPPMPFLLAWFVVVLTRRKKDLLF